MTNSNEQPHDLLERAIEALRDAPIPDGPPPEVVASTVADLKASATAAHAAAPHTRTQIMFRIMRYSSVAAAITFVAVVIAWLWLPDRSASRALAQMVDNVKKANSVSFVVRQKLGDRPELETKMFIQGVFIRYEIPDALIMILDTSERKLLSLEPPRKIARMQSLEGKIPAEELMDPLDRLRNLKQDNKDNVVELADEEVDKRKCHVYEIKGAAKALLVPNEFRLWIDAKTALPVKIHAQDEKTSLVYEQFRWDEPLKEELFSLRVPKGYMLEELIPAIIQPNRIYYHHGGAELRSLQPDGGKPEVQFVRIANSPVTYASDKAELMPDGRYLAIAYSNVTDKGALPPNRVLLWDRVQPKQPTAEIYVRPDGELQFWQFSADGERLYVSWWEQLPKEKEGRYGADVVDLKAKTKRTLKLPIYEDDGVAKEMRFAAAADGQGYLVIGRGLHLATADGKVVRRLSDAKANVIPSSVRLSSDGKQAVYATFHVDRSQALYVVAVAGGEPKELVSAAQFTDLRGRWSPDGKRIAYTSRLLDPNNPPLNRGDETYLKLIDPDGANRVTLAIEKVHPDGASLELIGWR
jgi:hypothetical protein